MTDPLMDEFQARPDNSESSVSQPRPREEQPMPQPILAPIIAAMRAKLDDARASGEITDDDMARAHQGLALTGDDHFQYQTIQAESHAGGDLHPDDALIVYAALGETGDPGNGGWSTDTDLATKYAVTQTIALLLKRAVEAA